MLAMSACALCLSSCSDDDNDGGGSDIEGGVYPGTWVVSHVQITEDGETDGGKVDPSQLLIELKLNEDGTFTYTYKEFVGEGDSFVQQGNWGYADGKLTLNATDGSMNQQMQVRRWTSKELVTFRSEEGNSETLTWKRK